MKKFEKYFNQASITAESRKLRPMIKKGDAGCPFCPQNIESLAKVVVEKWHDNELWVRIAVNKYPITRNDGAKGFHEVVIDTEAHDVRPRSFTDEHWSVLLTTLQERWLYLSGQPGIQVIQIFKNDGEDAGASISHSHWQIVALEKVPVTMERQYQLYHHEKNDECYLCHLQNEGFLIFETEYWNVWVPPIPEFNGEVWLVPKMHYQHYGELLNKEIVNLGKLIKYLLTAYEKIKPGVAYNICFMSGDVKGKWPYHFHIKIVMRIGHIAGFEIATGCHILTQSSQCYADEIKKILKGMYK